ncbi:MAG: hypothetical protein JOY80_11315 [Candidatus Dormibacteraeota bacterium]|nr:hypothetical protein [Candidatus Dormibacteraeota bacterium]
MTEQCQLCPARLAQNASSLLGVSLGDVVPPEAQRHLMNAQRELLLAVVVTIDHNASRSTRSQPKRTAKRRTSGASRRPKRVELE